MNPRALILILLAGVGFILVFFLTRAFLANNTQQAQPTQQIVKAVEGPEIMVAVDNLPVGTILTTEHITPQKWPSDSISEEYYAKQKDQDPIKNIIGKVVRYSIRAGSPITRNSLVAQGERGFMAAILNPGMRAVTVSVTPEAGVAGFIYPGDRVDVILTHRVKKADDRFNVSETVLSNVRVLGVDQFSEQDGLNVRVRETATLEVTPKMAEKVTVMTRIGTMSLVLRSLAQSNEDAPKDQDTKPIAHTVSGTQGGEVSQYLPTLSGGRIMIDRGSERTIIDLNNPISDTDNAVNSDLAASRINGNVNQNTNDNPEQ